MRVYYEEMYKGESNEMKGSKGDINQTEQHFIQSLRTFLSQLLQLQLSLSN